MIADGVSPRNTKFQTQKQFLRDVLEYASHTTRSLEEFQEILSEKYEITLKKSRGRFSYLHPDRNKPITGRSLGNNYEKEYLLKLIEENARARKAEEQKKMSQEIPVNPDTSEYPQEIPAGISDDMPAAVLFIKSDLRLVTDLQACVKAQQSKTYAQKVKLSNLRINFAVTSSSHQIYCVLQL